MVKYVYAYAYFAAQHTHSLTGKQLYELGPRTVCLSGENRSFLLLGSNFSSLEFRLCLVKDGYLYTWFDPYKEGQQVLEIMPCKTPLPLGVVV